MYQRCFEDGQAQLYAAVSGRQIGMKLLNYTLETKAITNGRNEKINTDSEDLFSISENYKNQYLSTYILISVTERAIFKKPLITIPQIAFINLAPAFEPLIHSIVRTSFASFHNEPDYDLFRAHYSDRLNYIIRSIKCQLITYCLCISAHESRHRIASSLSSYPFILPHSPNFFPSTL